jgi:hypothetical protein
MAEVVANYLGVEIDPASAVELPLIEKQSEGDAAAWAERYASSRVEREGTDYWR